ncbi:DUF3455 domain-containing protein [Ramlibacter rhizophilus]|uniref:DUF3455 domain-containing protein n=1 Tax=Ramlibacter rhizophilus TaxID=1781167 RepID=A0A4Z0BRC4_9BURK|nr:DUF3455 domain-containing protein [Ramlibacter rhizophilus]TFZ01302.1 DUF3455 domain-containing protein [Ramlibacter rhizophilus]
MIRLTFALSTAALLAACSGMKTMDTAMPMQAYDQSRLPASVQVPAGHRVAMETRGVGEITYECRVRAAGGHEWVFAGPKAELMDRGGKRVGRYWGPPATWENADGSKITGTQVAVAPASAGSIPFQLVKADPAMGMGAMTGVSYVQRVDTRGGVAPAAPCGGANVGARQVVNYQADYIFYKPA